MIKKTGERTMHHKQPLPGLSSPESQRGLEIPVNPNQRLITAFHEAGHSVGRVLTASVFGVPPEGAIQRIELKADKATTWGPMLTREMDQLLTAYNEQHGKVLDVAGLARAIETMRGKVNINQWLSARLLFTLMAPCAEALVSRTPFGDVWESPACASDWQEAIRDCTLAGIPSNSISSVIDDNHVIAVETILRPEVWCAICTLAYALPKSGTMRGKEAVRIVINGLREREA
jgi:hypothetical protein